MKNMKKKQLFKVALLCLQLSYLSWSTAFAQITITTADLPVAGENWTYFNNKDSVYTTFLIDGPGANKTWNFTSQWIINDTSTLQWKNPSGLPGATAYPTANLATIIYNKTFGSANFYEYWKKDASGMDVVGMYNQINLTGMTLTTNTTHQSIGNIFFPTPLNYGDSYNYSRREVYDNVCSNAAILPTRVVQVYSGNFSCDAWGTLTTPSQTAPVLRLKQTFTSWIDSNFTNINGTYILNNTYSIIKPTYYVFYKNGQGMRIMGLNADTTGFISYQFYTSGNSTAVEEINPTTQVNAFPNPIDEKVTFITNASKQSNLSIYNVNGEKVLEHDMSGVNKLFFNCAEMGNGLYIYKYHDLSQNKYVTGKLIVQHGKNN
jgi:Secretion system C-terminal sorting domain